MPNNRFKKQLETIFNAAGISIGGKEKHDVHIYNPEVFRRAITQGNLGLGESYMNGWWECDAIDELFYRLLRSRANEKVQPIENIAGKIAGRLFNLQTKSRSFVVGEKHYDTGNDLFRAMLDKRMIYSCGYWKDVNNLDDAQECKLRLIFDKLMLEPGMHLLDIGCGWGGAARFAAERYGVKVTAVTISNEQAVEARQACKNLPITIALTDYRNIEGSYDRIYSIGMFEHVGHKNYGEYFTTIKRCLKPGGLSLLHTIGGNEPCVNVDPWICRYIFPNSMIPSASQITRAAEGLFILEDWHAFAFDYYLTLTAWHKNFETHWNTIKERHSESFRRMWNYYLLSCAGAFKARSLQLWQILFSAEGLTGSYRAPR
ncbi:MAG: cyclopropane fatty acyl phospholipid synthase [Chlorobium sp.]|jgi:cyclopropane-fatty-acyl-phospholipid synthase|uniref:cyclopropane fatty acyl phospholipid synthase n=1 Tax=Chlorobium sp. TaxID=1095 RepID=UPI001D5F92D3|nr:cyclopropane fatty acyl phospholipid synthase [Chlorobium sp.]MBN1278383.1 cyclopropane fatty acyl phospholipid synthase [Chlorobiaceae bacterium]MCF8216060.1 cyclopropane fatty acyl phospholipid synthase [Chlorobium sp.]MCF8270961.1 cyclopropane fatty acyl phospholipid synthase [Chlorobium sp.]MCF8287335.1 cyclopropane fatty acyl phospholipid synthase [Chlorobium sp.]MCF8291421.1 cyclopropane fatty acyl phospholipid synthase [Chlorobium sp.]